MGNLCCAPEPKRKKSESFVKMFPEQITTIGVASQHPQEYDITDLSAIDTINEADFTADNTILSINYTVKSTKAS